MKKVFALPTYWRTVASLLALLQFCPFQAALLAIQPNESPDSAAHGRAVTTPPSVVMNVSPPENIEPNGKTSFSATPSDSEISNCRIFDEPLIPVGGGGSPADNAALASAITSFEGRDGTEDFQALTEFLASHPSSPWRAALQLNLGIWYERGCFYNRAFKSFIEAWNLTKGETHLARKALADRAVGELAEMYGSLGCAEALGPVLEEIKNRQILGSARQKIVSAQEMLGFMYYYPDHAYNCGPLALDGLWRSKKGKVNHVAALFDPEEGVIGRDLTQLGELAAKVGTPMVAVKRPNGAVFPIPSLVHWKTRHFDALVERRGDRYLLRNPFLNHDVWVSQEALEEETTGFLLVPADKVPSGWKKLSAKEGRAVWGGCHTGPANPDNTDKCQKSTGSCCNTPMAYYTIQLALTNLHISDTPVRYAPAWGPSVEFQVNYNHREANQPQTFNYSNLGRLWAFNWLSYVSDTNVTTNDASVSIYEQGGGTKRFSFPSTTTNNSTANSEDNSLLQRTTSGTNITRYDRVFPDGSKCVYSQPTTTTIGVPRKMFLKQIYDPQGNVATLSYDAQFRITGITDALGQVTTFTYAQPGDAYKISKVTDPFGRFAAFTYNNNGQLASITDPVGIVSQFSYQGDFIEKLTTPYGDTQFTAGESGVQENNQRWIEVTDPMGGKERVEYHQGDLSAIPDTDPAFYNGSVTLPGGLNIENTRVSPRNTFYWDKKAMMTAPGDYTKAHLYHWLHDIAADKITDVLESEKPALGSRIWYNYPNQSSPYFEIGSSANVIRAGRFVDDQHTLQLLQYEYNAQGNRTKSIDPLGRTTTYVYATNGIDLVEARNTTGGLNERLAAFTYNTQHLPLTLTDAAGQATTLTYNAQGQPLTRTVMRNGQNEATTLSYDANGHLQSITAPVPGAATSFTYDGFGRVRTLADSEGYTVTYDYDAIDRVTKITYPDGTYEQTNYNKLDAEWQRDRAGRWTHLFHDRLQRIARVDDAAGRSVNYNWCVCGALDGLKDGEGRTTRFAYDLEKRVTQKTYADGSAVQYTYDLFRGLRTQRLDTQERVTHYAYNLDDSVQQVSYTGEQGTATPTVSLAYDLRRFRVTSMTDGTGATTYAYHPIAAGTVGAGQLASVDGPLANDTVSYTYDELGRKVISAVNGVAASWSYDALGRVTSASNPLGNFGYSYAGTTGRVSTVNYPNGQTSTYTYFPNNAPAGAGNGNRRLQSIWHKFGSGATLSKHDYGYSAAGEITSWRQQTDANPAVQNDFGYDQGSELLAATRKDAGSGIVQKQYSYAYDKAGNRTVEQVDAAIAGATHNALNQLTARSGAGPMVFEGTVSEPSTVSVAGHPAAVDGSNRFKATVNVSPGAQSLEIRARDGNNNETVRHAQITVTQGAAGQSFTYDANGSLTGDGVRSFAWDAENRLVKITVGTDVKEFVYNGAGQRVTEKFNGAITKRWVWDGTTLREERGGSNVVTNRYYGQGIVTGTTTPAPAMNKFYYTRDHLGSIRELTDYAGVIRARYDYDTWGRRTKLSGDLEAELAYTGHLWDAFSGVYLTVYRAYDPDLGRWLSRDLIGEKGGINLYEYVGSHPLSRTDPLGLTYINLNVSMGFLMGASGGLIWDNRGMHPYLGFGIMSSPGASLTVAPNEDAAASSCKWGVSVSAGAGVAVGGGIDEDGNTSFEYGLGTPGLQGILFYTW